MNSRLKELFSNTLVFSIANFSSKILVFLMVPLYTAVLTTEEYGISDMVGTISGLMAPVLSLTIASAVLRFCFLEEYQNEEVYTVGHRVITYGTIVSIILTAILFFFKIFPQLELYIWFVPFQFYLHAYSTVLSNYTRGIGEIKVSAVAGVTSTFVIVSLNLLFLLVLKWGILGYMLSFVAGPLASIVVMWLKIRDKHHLQKTIDPDLRRQMIKFSAPLIPNDLSWWALDSFNRFFILTSLSVSAVGIYSASSKIPAILTALCGIFSQAWMLSALNGYGTEDNTRFIRNVHRKLYSLLAVVTASFIMLVKPIALLLLSGEFSSCWYMIPFLMISVFLGAMVGFYGSIYSAERKNSMQFISTLGGALLSVLIMLALLNVYGIIVAAVSNMVGYFIIWIIRKEGIKKYIDVGMSTLYCVFQIVLLIGEAVLISLSLWIPASILFITLVIINRIELVESTVFFKAQLMNYINKKRNG